MISVLLYGRNDAHGYNLHRRAALSLNCLAEILADPEDEIIFVDYNTPDELPTFVEAIADTLTDRCLDLLRVIRVPAALHRARFARLTHLPAVEPVCRNTGARRANPANRWLLSTNTDMILVPRSLPSLTEICADLPDGYYALPKFELPEWLWERLPRSDPSRVLAEVGRLGPRLHLDEPTLSHEWNRFDAPGDFQLCLREDFVSIDGCDEAMILGWHVDSNLSRRLLLHRGLIDSLEHAIAGYHCNHSRIPTVYHEASGVANDPSRFVQFVEESELPDQRDTWGLADVELEEVSIRGRVGVDFAEALASVVPPPDGPKRPSHDVDAILGLSYDSRHVFPFVADSIAVSAPEVKVGYVGCNSALEKLLASLADELGFELFCAADSSSIDRLMSSADLLVVDLGLDIEHATEVGVAQEDVVPLLTYPAALRSVMEAFERVVDHERDRLELGEHPRRFVLVHSVNQWTNAYVLSHLDCSHTSTHSRVRRATVKLVATPPDEQLAVIEEQLAIDRARAYRLMRWGARLDEPEGQLVLQPNHKLSLVNLTDFQGFRTGWAIPDADAVWTQGPRAELAVELAEAPRGRAFLAITFGRVGARQDESLHAHLLVDGASVASQTFQGGTRSVTWRAELPAAPIANRAFEVALEFEPPPSWSEDTRQLGLHVRSLEVERGVVGRLVRDDLDRLRVVLRRVASGLGPTRRSRPSSS